MAEMHVVLLKAVLREEDTSNTTFGTRWSERQREFHAVFHWCWRGQRCYGCTVRVTRSTITLFLYQEAEDYPYGPVENKIKVSVLGRPVSSPRTSRRSWCLKVIQYDDHCRVCHKLGDLAAVRPACGVPPGMCVKSRPGGGVPEDEWQCEVCVAHKVPGVTDCAKEIQKNKPYSYTNPSDMTEVGGNTGSLNRRLIMWGIWS